MAFQKWSLMAPLLAFLLLGAAKLISQPSESLLISTTTSLYDSGLLDALGEVYEELTGEKIRFIPLGTLQALEQGRVGNVDAVFVHAPTLESKYLRDNIFAMRKIVAYNFFVIVGPPSDPALIGGLPPAEALRRIAEGGFRWVSRGDNSATNLKEKDLWISAGYSYEEVGKKAWFLESGSGMGSTLLVADEREAYTLSDIGTFLKYSRENIIQLRPLVREDRELLNVYSAMVVNPSLFPSVKFERAVKFIRFLASDEGQGLIGEFALREYGEPLFYPAVKALENGLSEVGSWIRSIAFIDNAEGPSEVPAGGAHG